MLKKTVKQLNCLLNGHCFIFKITGIFFFLFYSYVMYHHVTNGIYVERFEGYFLTIVDFYLNGKTTLDQFSVFPLFYPNMDLDLQLPIRISHMKLSESYYPNFFIFFIYVASLTGISTQLLLTIPLGLFFIPVLYLNLIRSMISQYVPQKSLILISSLLFVYYIIYLGITRYYGSFYVAPVTFGLILICLFLLKKILTVPDLRFFLLICILLVSLIYYWHSAFMQLFYILSAIFIVCLVLQGLESLGSSYFHIKGILYTRIYSIFVFSCVIGLAFSQLWRNTYLKVFFQEAQLSEFISLSILKFMGQVPFYVPYVYNYKEYFFGKLYFISLQLILLISLFLLISSLFLWLNQSFKKKKFSINLPVIFGLSIILAQIFMVGSYYKTNSMNFALIPLYLPLFSVAILLSPTGAQKTDYSLPKILEIFTIGIVIFLIILSILCNISLNLSSEAGSTSITKYNNAKQSFYWLNENVAQDTEVIVDFNIIGLYGQLESKNAFNKIQYLDLSPDIYQILVGDKSLNSIIQGRWVVVDHATMRAGLPIHTVFNRAFLKEEISRIETSSSQAKIYMDKFLSLYKFTIITNNEFLGHPLKHYLAS